MAVAERRRRCAMLRMTCHTSALLFSSSSNLSFTSSDPQRSRRDHRGKSDGNVIKRRLHVALLVIKRQLHVALLLLRLHVALLLLRIASPTESWPTTLAPPPPGRAPLCAPVGSRARSVVPRHGSNLPLVLCSPCWPPSRVVASLRVRRGGVGCAPRVINWQMLASLRTFK